jgi:hypothetical protein
MAAVPLEEEPRGLINQAAVRPEVIEEPPPEPDPEQSEQKKGRPRLGARK